MNFRERTNGRRNAILDISPLIDVVFLLLIFFMVSTTFLEEAGLPLNLPSSVSRGIKKMENVVVTITEAGDIFVGDRKTDPSTLSSTIAEQLKASVKKRL